MTKTGNELNPSFPYSNTYVQINIFKEIPYTKYKTNYMKQFFNRVLFCVCTFSVFYMSFIQKQKDKVLSVLFIKMQKMK